VFILRSDSELNSAYPANQSPIESCLNFAKKNRELLSFSVSCDLDSLCYYFVIRKDFSSKQRQELASICGRISTVLLSNNVSAAVTLIKQNKVLLDEYNHTLLNSINGIITDPLSIKTKFERHSVFNVAGFVLAQIS
jgi:hypothetical protein